MRYVTKVAAAVLRVRNNADVAVATAAAPTRVWPEAAATVNVSPPVLTTDQSNESPTAYDPEASTIAPVSRVAVTPAPVVEVTTPLKIAAAVNVPVAFRAVGAGCNLRPLSSVITGAVPT